MTIAIYPGSFDPITNGHIDIIKSGTEIFDKVIIAVSKNIGKEGFLPIDTRVNLIKESLKDFENIEVTSYEGLTVDFAKNCGAKVLIRGLRNSLDFEYEMEMAQTNSALCCDIKTVFLTAKPEHNYISSSAVREILINKGDISKLVPNPVLEYLVYRK